MAPAVFLFCRHILLSCSCHPLCERTAVCLTSAAKLTTLPAITAGQNRCPATGVQPTHVQDSTEVRVMSGRHAAEIRVCICLSVSYVNLIISISSLRPRSTWRNIKVLHKLGRPYRATHTHTHTESPPTKKKKGLNIVS